jgi:hypothetical protein
MVGVCCGLLQFILLDLEQSGEAETTLVIFVKPEGRPDESKQRQGGGVSGEERRHLTWKPA